MRKKVHETAERLYEAIEKALGASERPKPSDVARLLDQSPQSVNNWASRGVSRDGMLAAQSKLGINATWLQTGEGEMFDVSAKHISIGNDSAITEETRRVIGQLLPADKGNVVTWETPDDLEPDENRVWIDRYDYRFSAGTGVIQWEIRQKKALPFDVGFFKALGVKPQECKLAQVHGRSMEPYLFNRDLMMLCTSKTHVRDGHVYAIYFEDEPLVKQIFKEPGGTLRLHSYNSEFLDKLVTADQLESLHIAGEVIYRSGSGLAGGN